MSYRVRQDCRLCNGSNLRTVLTLTPTPLANEFVKSSDPEQEKFPLCLARCEECGHVQLPVVVDPDRLFANYVYVSGTSPSFVEHFRKYADECIIAYWLSAGSTVVEIGSNDGTLLRQFKKRGMRVLGIDPAKKIAEEATASGIQTVAKFFTRSLVPSVIEEVGNADLVVANNVFAHADDLSDIALGVKDLLKSSGRFVFEVQYLVDLVKKNLFDMIYHEHLSYHSLAPLVRFFKSIGMSMVDAQHVDTHGGSIRCVVSPSPDIPASARLQYLLIAEKNALSGDSFDGMKKNIDAIGESVAAFIEDSKERGFKVAGYGAPAKLTTLAYHLGIEPGEIAYVVDDSQWKQGLLTPGMRIPVVPSSRLESDKPDRVMVFAWNFADSIIAKFPELSGRFVVPLPSFREA